MKPEEQVEQPLADCAWANTRTIETNSSHDTANPISENVIRFQKKDPRKKYKILEVLGEGSIGAVSSVKIKAEAVGGSAYNNLSLNNEVDVNCCCFSLARRRGSSRGDRRREKSNRNKEIMYAMKSIQIKRINDAHLDELRNEISLLQSMDHPNIVKAYEVYEWKGQIYVIMEHCSGGDLYARGPYTEKEACRIILKLCSAITYMHDNKIIHRDLKLENIMFDSVKKEEESEIKVIDFGLSTKFQPGVKLTDGVGTIYTMAPQVLQGVYTCQADMWSIGVIAYILLSGFKPFPGRQRKVVIDKIMRCDYNFNREVWKNISPEAINFISRLIELNPKKRLSAKEALRHPWLASTDFASITGSVPKSVLMTDIENNIYTFANTSQIKKLALMIVAHKSSPEETKELRKAFNQYDKNGTGTISKDEFQMVLKDCNQDLSEDEIDEMFNSIDINDNGVILYTEFLAATLETCGNLEEERIADAFDRLDADDSGYISKKNLQDLLSHTASTPDRIDAIFNEVNIHNDGRISFDEFLRAIQKSNTKDVEELYRLDSEMNLNGSKVDSSVNDTELTGVDSFVVGGKYDNPPLLF